MFTTIEQLVDHIKPKLDIKTVVLVKGSRTSAMEKVIDKLVIGHYSR